MTNDRPDRRVLRLITRLNVGGPARQALLLTRRLAADFPTTLAAGTPSATEGELSDPEVPVRRVPLVRPPNPAADTHAILAVRRLLNETRPAILHTHMAKAGAVGRCAAELVASPPRTVHTFHGHVLEGYFTPRVQRTFIAVERALARRSDALIAVSTEVRDALLDLRIGVPSQYHVISLGLDLSSYLAVEAPTGALREKLGLDSRTPLVGVVGRLVPIKDNHTILAAMAGLPGVHLAMVGDGEARGELEVAAKELAIDDRVHFTGWSADVAGALSDMDVVALSSRNEGTPVALIEAAAAARPVVATRVGGVPLVVKDGVTGYLAASGDVEDIAGLLHRLLDDATARRRMGLAGREYVRQRFGEDRLVREIADLYSELCSTPRRAARVRLRHRSPQIEYSSGR
jgi:glycosyltransferase involved in cell wall biosynthesis